MQNNFVDYNWRNHVPSLQPVDLAICALIGLALSVSFIFDPPRSTSAWAPKELGPGTSFSEELITPPGF